VRDHRAAIRLLPAHAGSEGEGRRLLL
jgi:hypothetical protein